MDRKKTLVALISISLAFFAIAAVNARLPLNTPLYTIRMEQASSQMNFLPTEMNIFTYTTEKGFELNYDVSGSFCNVDPLGTGKWTCYDSTCGTCDLPSCEGGNTCELTCPATCVATCGSSCGGTCWPTCEWTCNQWTCDGSTCDYPC